jgi:hypothetical protein
MPWEHSYSMANQVVQPYLSVKRVYKYIGTDIQE